MPLRPPQVTDIEPDQKVRTAMNEINAAQRMRMAAKEKAEADRVMVVTRAQGEATVPVPPNLMMKCHNYARCT